MQISRGAPQLSHRVPFAALLSVVALTAISALPIAPGMAPALAQGSSSTATPYDDSLPTISDQMWANPNARSADPDNGVSAQVTAQSAAIAQSTDTLEMTITVRNSSKEKLSNLELRAQRADPVDSAAGVATSLLANQGEYPWVGEFIPVDTTIAPGKVQEIRVTVPVGESTGVDADTDSGSADSTSSADSVALPGLGILNTGVHPVLFNLNGTLGDGDTSFLAGARTTLSIADDDANAEASSGNDGAGADGTNEATATPAPGLTVLWPLSSAAVAVPGEVGDAPKPSQLYLPDETLATELSAGGRLRGLLDTWRNATNSATQMRDATCLAIDPDLLETVDRMQGGYRVGPVVPSPVDSPTRLRDSWGHHDRNADSEAGTGADAAASWLSDLRDAVADSCVIPLPFANADINAIAASADSWLTAELRMRGVDTITEILGVSPATGIYLPGSGYIEADTLPTLAGESNTSDNSNNGASGNTAATSDATTTPPTPVTAIVADSTLSTSSANDTTNAADATSTSAPTTRSAVATLDNSSVRALHFPAELGSALAATGTRPETAAYASPSRRRDLAADGPASRMAAAVAVLDQELRTAKLGTGQVLAVPPAAWSVDATDAATFLDAVDSHFSDGSATPVALGAALSAPATPASLVEEPTATDPAPVNDGEALNVSQIAGHLRNFTEILDDVPNIALTRRIYTQPMFDDLLRSLSNTGRRVRTEAADVREDSANRTSRVTGLAYELRNAVSLLPPGNVFTRTSDSSPLIVVARNGLPLPVTVRVNYDAAPGVTLNTPGVQQIPARGSVTLQMTSSIPTETEQADLTMYLSTPGDIRISEDVQIRVASVPGLGRSAIAVIVGAVVLIAATTWTLRRRRHASRRSSSSPRRGTVLNDGDRD